MNKTKYDLHEILDNHLKWVKKEEGGKCADLSGADLSCADLSGARLSGGAKLSRANLSWAYLSGAYLSGANLSGAYLAGANLSGANLSWADLSGADLSWADLSGARLSGANLSGADLSCADLSGARLSGANLSGADLSWANLSGADLSGANLSCADLSGANLSGANLSCADLSGVHHFPYIPITCPDMGAFIGWKKVGGYIIKLQIPEDAKRSSAHSRKCRCDKAVVLAIENIDGTDVGITVLINRRYVETAYVVGDMVFPDSWDDNRWNECSHGIHFFVNRQEAVDYKYA